MLARYVIYFLFAKKRNRFNRLLYTCVHTSSRLLKLGSNFREICLARRVSTARSHPYKLSVICQNFTEDKFFFQSKTLDQYVIL